MRPLDHRGARFCLMLLLGAGCGGGDAAPEPPEPFEDLSGQLYFVEQQFFQMGERLLVGRIDAATQAVTVIDSGNFWGGMKVSPTGDWLALSSRGIYRMDLATRRITELYPDLDFAYSNEPAISPDARRVAWLTTNDSGTAIFVGSPSGGDATRRLGPIPSFSPVALQWLSDRELAWLGPQVDTAGLPLLNALDVGTGQVRTIGGASPRSARGFVVRHRQRDLVLMLGRPLGGELWLADLDGRLQRRVGLLPTVVLALPLTVSPDGQYVAIAALGSDGFMDPFIVHVATGHTRMVPYAGFDVDDLSWGP